MRLLCKHCGEQMLIFHPGTGTDHPTDFTVADAGRSALAELALEFGDYRSRGYKVEPYGKGEWMLTLDGSQLMVADYGGLAPTKYAAELEAYRRIAQEER